MATGCRARRPRRPALVMSTCGMERDIRSMARGAAASCSDPAENVSILMSPTHRDASSPTRRQLRGALHLLQRGLHPRSSSSSSAARRPPSPPPGKQLSRPTARRKRGRLPAPPGASQASRMSSAPPRLRLQGHGPARLPAAPSCHGWRLQRQARRPPPRGLQRGDQARPRTWSAR